MTDRTKLPTIVLGRSMRDTSSEKPAVTFELEADTGQIFEVSFSLRGILSTAVMARNWAPLREELDQLDSPGRAAVPMSYEAAKLLLETALRHSAEQDATLAAIEPLCSSVQFASFKHMVGQTMGAMLLELINPVVSKYPDLKPREMT